MGAQTFRVKSVFSESQKLNCVIVILCKALSDTRVMQIQSSIVRCAIQQGLVAELVSGLSGMISCLLRGEKEYWEIAEVLKYFNAHNSAYLELT